MPTCPQCGARNPRENTVCRNCGAVLGVEPSPVQPEPSPQEPAPVDSLGEAEIPLPDSEALTLPSPDTEDLPIPRAALFGVGAALVCGVLWYLVESQWVHDLVGPIASFISGWVIGTAIVFGANQKRGRPLQFLALGITLLTILAAQFAILTTLRDVPPANFLLELWRRLTEQVFNLVFLALALWQAYTTPGVRRRPAQQQPPAPAEEGEAAEGAEGEDAAEEKAAGEDQAKVEEVGVTCARCKNPTTLEEALVLPGRRGARVAVCANCVAELEAEFAAETEDLQINRAVLFGAGAAILSGVVWFLAEYFSEWPLAFIGWLGALFISEAVRFGAGRKRGRPLQWLSVGLTVTMIVGTLLALSLADPEGLAVGLTRRLQDLFTIVILMLALWQAYTGPAPRRLPQPRRQSPG